MSNPIGSIGQSIALDRSGRAALFAQLADELARRILAGDIASGVRLPAERELAAALAVNRATIGRAYRELETRGLATSRVGSGTVVTNAAPRPASAPEPPPAAPARAAAAVFSRGIRDLAAAAGRSAAAIDPNAIDFSLMLPDVALFPKRKLAEAVARALEHGDEVLQYGSPNGLLPLRQILAARLEAKGIAAAADEVLVVNGIQQALDLVAKVALDRGDTVLVESPTYANVLPLLRLYGVHVEGVPLDDEGIEPRALEHALATHRPKLLYTIPTFHNPTGVTMSRRRRLEVLRACARHGTLVVEDGYEEDLRYEGEPLPPLAALDRSGAVIHLGTFSKGLFPGLRLGFVLARGETQRFLTLAKRYSDYHADLFAQSVLVEILASGEYDRHLARICRTYRARLKRTLAALRAHLPPGVRWREPEGGYIVWIELPPEVRASEVAAEVRSRGVAILPGRPFFTTPGDGEGALRLSISRTDPERIEEGIAILGQAIAAASAAPRSRGPAAEAPALV